MTESATTTTARAAAIEDFAAALRRLRESVGTPSFREMSGRSRAISHTTLHEAAQGNRLPSWSTTVEFVKACGGEPGDFRQRWDAANQTVRTAAVASTHGVGPVDDAQSDDAVVEELVRDPPPAPPSTRRRRVLQALAAVAVLGAAAVTVGVVATSGTNHSSANPSRRTSLIAANCPIAPHNPPPAAATTPGDSAAFVADVTLADCTHLRTGETAIKVWRIKNRGTVAWRGYSLHRVELPQRRDQCQTITDIPIDDTPPGAFVDIRTEVAAPKTPTFCFAHFAVIDAAGRVAFPGGRPLNFQLIVDRPS